MGNKRSTLSNNNHHPNNFSNTNSTQHPRNHVNSFANPDSGPFPEPLHNPILLQYFHQQHEQHLRSITPYNKICGTNSSVLREYPLQSIYILHYSNNNPNPMTNKPSFNITEFGRLNRSIAPFIGTFAIAPQDLGHRRWDLLNCINNEDLFNYISIDFIQQSTLLKMIAFYDSPNRPLRGITMSQGLHCDIVTTTNWPYPLSQRQTGPESSQISQGKVTNAKRYLTPTDIIISKHSPLDLEAHSPSRNTKKRLEDGLEYDEFNLCCGIPLPPVKALLESSFQPYLPQSHSIPLYTLPYGIEHLFDIDCDVLKAVRARVGGGRGRDDDSNNNDSDEQRDPQKVDHSVQPRDESKPKSTDHDHFSQSMESIQDCNNQNNIYLKASSSQSPLPYISIALPFFSTPVRWRNAYSVPPREQMGANNPLTKSIVDPDFHQGALFPLKSSNMATDLIPSPKALLDVSVGELDEVNELVGCKMYSINGGFYISCITISLDATINYNNPPTVGRPGDPIRMDSEVHGNHNGVTFMDPIHKCVSQIANLIRGGSIHNDLLDLNIHIFVLGVDGTHLDDLMENYSKEELIREFLKIGYSDEKIIIHYLPPPYRFERLDSNGKKLKKPIASLTETQERVSKTLWNEIYHTFFKIQIKKSSFFYHLVSKYQSSQFWINYNIWPSSLHTSFLRYCRNIVRLEREKGTKKDGDENKNPLHYSKNNLPTTSQLNQNIRTQTTFYTTAMILLSFGLNSFNDHMPKPHSIDDIKGQLRGLFGDEVVKVIDQVLSSQSLQKTPTNPDHVSKQPGSDAEQQFDTIELHNNLNNLLIDPLIVSQSNPKAPFAVLSNIFDGNNSNGANGAYTGRYNQSDAKVLFSEFSTASLQGKSPINLKLSHLSYTPPTLLGSSDRYSTMGIGNNERECDTTRYPIIPVDNDAYNVNIDDLYGYPYNAVIPISTTAHHHDTFETTISNSNSPNQLRNDVEGDRDDDDDDEWNDNHKAKQKYNGYASEEEQRFFESELEKYKNTDYIPIHFTFEAFITNRYMFLFNQIEAKPTVTLDLHEMYHEDGGGAVGNAYSQGLHGYEAKIKSMAKEKSYSQFDLTLAQQDLHHDGTIRHVFDPSNDFPLLNTIHQEMKFIQDKDFVAGGIVWSVEPYKKQKQIDNDRIDLEVNGKQYKLPIHFSTQIHSLFPSPYSSLRPIHYNVRNSGITTNTSPRTNTNNVVSSANDNIINNINNINNSNTSSNPRSIFHEVEWRGLIEMKNSLRFFNAIQKNLIMEKKCSPVCSNINYTLKSENILRGEYQDECQDLSISTSTAPMRWLFGVHLFQYHHEVTLDTGSIDRINSDLMLGDCIINDKSKEIDVGGYTDLSVVQSEMNEDPLSLNNPSNPLHHLSNILKIPYISPLTEVMQEIIPKVAKSQSLLSKQWGDLIKVSQKWYHFYNTNIFEPYQITNIVQSQIPPTDITSNNKYLPHGFPGFQVGNAAMEERVADVYNNAPFLSEEWLIECNGHLLCPMHVIFVIPPDSASSSFIARAVRCGIGNNNDKSNHNTTDNNSSINFKLHDYTDLTTVLSTDYHPESIEAQTIARFRENLNNNCQKQLDLFWKRHYFGVPLARIQQLWHFHLVPHHQLEQVLVQIQSNAVLERLKLYGETISP